MIPQIEVGFNSKLVKVLPMLGVAVWCVGRRAIVAAQV
jgi:hypothetical protein